MKPKHIDMYMSIAHQAAKCSHAVRLKVGCIAVRDHQIISIGYNGTPQGWDNSCEISMKDGTLLTRSEVIHAEANCIAKLCASTISSEGATIFVTHAPCLHCAKLIYGAGIKKVVYDQLYKSIDGLDFLNKVGIEVQKWKQELH